MARKRSRKGKGGNIFGIVVTLAVVVLLVGIGYLLMSPSKTNTLGKPQHFSIRDYRNDGSRLAVPGNHYVLEGRIESIETIGNDRMIAISMKNNRNERLPLLVTKDTHLSVNLTRNDYFIFDVECRTGRDASGNEIKGILVVKNAESVK
ncbi:MAG: hypothetical protein IJB31_07510 [Akkermansia sp.]|nr:hypothetical protein [Akkermansia sp.]